MKHTVKDARAGFYMIQNDVLDDYGAEMGPFGIAIYNALCRFASRDGTTFPTLQKLADVTGMSRSAVKKHLSILDEMGLIEISERYTADGDRDSNLYTVKNYVGVGRQKTDVGHEKTDLGHQETDGGSPENSGVGHQKSTNNTYINNTQLPILPEHNHRDDTVNAESKKERGAVHKCWQQNMPGTMTPIIAEQIDELIDEYGATTMIHAITVAVNANVRTMRFVKGVLTKEANAPLGTNGHNGNGKGVTVTRREGEEW